MPRFGGVKVNKIAEMGRTKSVGFADSFGEEDSEEEVQALEGVTEDELDPTTIRENWKIGDKVEIFSNSQNKWFDGEITDITNDEEGEWLEITAGHITKEVDRYSSDVRIPGMEEDGYSSDESSDSFEEETVAPSDSDEESESESSEEWDESKTIVVFVDRCGSSFLEGKYECIGVENKAPFFQHKVRKDIFLSQKYKGIWVFYSEDDEWFTAEADGKEPPSYGWEEENGTCPLPGVRYHYIEKKEEEETPDEDIALLEDYEEIPVTVEERPFGVRFEHANELLVVSSVSAGKAGEKAGLIKGDMLFSIGEEEFADSRELLRVWRNCDLPFKAVFGRPMPSVPVFHIKRAGTDFLNGTYSLHGTFNGELRFTNDADPNVVLQMVEKDHDDEYDEVLKTWSLVKDNEYYYSAETTLDFPPPHGWEENEEVSDLPCPGLVKYDIAQEALPVPVLKRVMPMSQQIKVEFEFPEGGLIPIVAPRIEHSFSACTSCGRETAGHTQTLLLRGLKNGKKYEVFVKAQNQIMSSLSINWPELVMPLGHPKVKIKRIQGGDEHVTVYFNDESGYDEEIQATFTVTTDPPTKTYENVREAPVIVDGLENGVEYLIEVIASNTTGRAQDCGTMMPLEIPPMPTITKVEAGNRECLVYVDAPRLRDPKVRAYFVCSSDPPTRNIKAEESPIRMPKLVNGQHYTFTVKTVNTSGSTENPEPSESVMPKGPPPCPKITKIVPLEESAQIHFKAEDLATEEYKATWFAKVFPDDGLRWQSRESPILIDQLENGKTYKVQIVGKNKEGLGPKSTLSEVTPLMHPPEPTSVLPVAGDKEAMVYWVCEDMMEQKYSGIFVISSDPPSRTLEVKRTKARMKKLENGQKYTFTVKAVNPIGTAESKASAAIRCSKFTSREDTEDYKKRCRKARDKTTTERIKYMKQKDKERREHRQKRALKKKKEAQARARKHSEVEKKNFKQKNANRRKTIKAQAARNKKQEEANMKAQKNKERSKAANARRRKMSMARRIEKKAKTNKKKAIQQKRVHAVSQAQEESLDSKKHLGSSDNHLKLTRQSTRSRSRGKSRRAQRKSVREKKRSRTRSVSRVGAARVVRKSVISKEREIPMMNLQPKAQKHEIADIQTIPAGRKRAGIPKLRPPGGGRQRGGAASTPPSQGAIQKRKSSHRRLHSRNPSVDFDASGKTFVFTGRMNALGRTDAKNYVKAAGGQVASHVDASTSAVVTGGVAGKKLEQAWKLGIPVWDEAKFLNMFGLQKSEHTED